MSSEPKSESLRALYWRDEILQLVFWLQGEGFGDAVDAPTLERFLGIEGATAQAYLDRLVSDGFLHEVAGRYELSERGRADGARIFAEEFADLTRPAHGECGSDCWCHQSSDEAEACARDRAEAGGA